MAHETPGFRVEFRILDQEFGSNYIEPVGALRFSDALDAKGIPHTIKQGTYVYHKGLDASGTLTRGQLRVIASTKTYALI